MDDALEEAVERAWYSVGLALVEHEFHRGSHFIDDALRERLKAVTRAAIIAAREPVTTS